MFVEHVSFALHDQRLDLSYWFELLISNMHNLELIQIAFGDPVL